MGVFGYIWRNMKTRLLDMASNQSHNSEKDVTTPKLQRLFIEINEDELGHGMGSDTLATVDVKHSDGRISRFFFSVNAHGNDIRGIVSTPTLKKTIEKDITARKQDFRAQLEKAIADSNK